MTKRWLLLAMLACLLCGGAALANDDVEILCSLDASLGSAEGELVPNSGPPWGDDEGNDEGDDEGDDRVFCVCYSPTGDPEDAETVCVGLPKLCILLARGATLGPCERICGGPEGLTCDEGQFCAKPLGACAEDARGVCKDLPPVCPGVYDPVCGCDGVTYSNRCYANVAGVAVDSLGECEEPVVCGGTAGDTCEQDQYCMRPEGECSEEAEGVCAERPMECPPIFMPVCGCDGITYPNACLAAFAGVTIASRGPCEAQPQVCGGTTGVTCDEGRYCRLPEGECSEEQVEGVCTEKPMVCPPILVRVCGCDGVTYDNPCVAAAAGVNVASQGECGPEPQACGGTAGLTCEEGSFCKRPLGECAEDAEGLCTAVPALCPAVVAPVCGCDGMTYVNECFAEAASVSVLNEGECSMTSKSMSGAFRRGWRRSR